MFARLKVERRWRAPFGNLKIVVLIGAVGHVIGGQVGDNRQHICQRGVFGFGLFVQARNFGFFLGHQRAQAAEFGLVATGFGSANQFAGFVLFGLRGFGGGDFAAPRLVLGQQCRRQWRIAPAGEARIKSGGGVTNGADIVHQKSPVGL